MHSSELNLALQRTSMCLQTKFEARASAASMSEPAAYGSEGNKLANDVSPARRRGNQYNEQLQTCHTKIVEFRFRTRGSALAAFFYSENSQWKKKKKTH